MADTEIIEKLTGLVVFEKLRITGLAGEGKDHVVLRADHLPDGEKVVMKLYQSNPMFLLNEVDFDFLPESGSEDQRRSRHLATLDKLLTSCEREFPGLFFWHLKFLYARILSAFCRDAQEYNAGVIDTTTTLFQNEELLELGRATARRLESLTWLDLEYWEHRIKPTALALVLDSLRKFPPVRCFRPSRPTTLLAVVFSEGFFGTIPSEETRDEPHRFLGDLRSDSPPQVEAEGRLRIFLDDVEYRDIDPNLPDECAVIHSALEQLRIMLLGDALDDAKWLKGLGDDFLMRYNAGRNTLLRGLPRFLRTISAHAKR